MALLFHISSIYIFLAYATTRVHRVLIFVFLCYMFVTFRISDFFFPEVQYFFSNKMNYYELFSLLPFGILILHKIIDKNMKINFKFIDKLVIFLFFWGLFITIIWAIYYGDSLLSSIASYRVIFYTFSILYVLRSYIGNNKEWDEVHRIIILFSLIICLLYIFNFFVGIDLGQSIDSGALRQQEFFEYGKLHLGGTIFIFYSFLFLFSSLMNKTKNILSHYLFLFISFFAIVLVKYKSAIMAVVIAVMSMVLLVKKDIKIGRIIILLIIVGLIIYSNVIPGSRTIIPLFQNMFRNAFYNIQYSEGTWGDRVILAQQKINVLGNKIYIGAGTTSIKSYIGRSLASSTGSASTIWADSGYATLLSVFGIVGIIVFIVINLYIISKSAKLIREEKIKENEKIYLSTFFAFCIVIIITSFVGNHFLEGFIVYSLIAVKLNIIENDLRSAEHKGLVGSEEQ